MVTTEQIHDTSFPIRERMEALIRLKQQQITDAIAELDTVKFHTDTWLRGDNGGGGQSMVLQNGTTFEKGGVNISIVHGKLPPQAVERMRADHSNLKGSSKDGSVNFSLVDYHWLFIQLTLMPQLLMPTIDILKPVILKLMKSKHGGLVVGPI